MSVFCLAALAVTAAAECEWRGGFFVVATPYRTGSTVLFNVVRLIAELNDPNTISGYEISRGRIDGWLSFGVPVVVKTHSYQSIYANASPTAVFTAHRPLPDVVWSMISLRRAESARKTVRAICADLASSYKKSSVIHENGLLKGDYDYGDIASDLRRVVSHVAGVMGSCGGEELIDQVTALVGKLRPVSLSLYAENPRTLMLRHHVTQKNDGYDRVYNEAMSPDRCGALVKYGHSDIPY